MQYSNFPIDCILPYDKELRIQDEIYIYPNLDPVEIPTFLEPTHIVVSTLDYHRYCSLDEQHSALCLLDHGNYALRGRNFKG